MRPCYLIATAIILFFIDCSYADSSKKKPSAEKEYAELTAQYLKLRNTDVNVSRAVEWESLAKKLSHLADRNPKFVSAPDALYRSAILYDLLFRNFGGRDRALLAVRRLELIAKLYPGHRLADDALVKKGDILQFDLNEHELAKRSYSEVVEAYKRSDMYEVAQVRIRNLVGGEDLFLEQDEPKFFNENEATEKPLIVIDPGHGGEDYGAVGVGGVMEKDLVLSIALELEKILVSELDAVVRLTRRTDTFVPLADRTNLANDYEADLFLSLHVNASPKGKLAGLETFYLDNSGDEATKKLAERENRSLRFEESGGGDLGFMLSDLIQSAKLDESIILANVVHKGLLRHLKPRWEGIRDLKVRKAPFYVLVGAHMPCILVELFFVDNREDGRRLANRKFRSDIAQGLLGGIREYLQNSAGSGNE